MNQRAPIDFVLSQPLSETLTVTGLAETMMAAHVQAQAGLTGVLGGDAVEAWSLKAMDHLHVLRGDGTRAVEYTAQFVRNPDFEAEDAA